MKLNGEDFAENMNFNSPIAKRLLKGAGGHGFSQLTHAIIRFIELPVFIYFWGTQGYGEWLILAAIPAYLTLSDLGFVGVANRELIMAVGNNDRKLGLSIFQSGWVITLALLLSIFFLTLLMVSFFSIGNLIENNFSFSLFQANQIEIAIVLLTLYTLLGLQSLLLYGAFACEGQYGKGIFFQSLTVWLEFILIILVLALDGGITAVAGAYLTGRLLGIVWMRWQLTKVSPWIHYGFSQVSWILIKKMLPLSVAGLAFPLGNALNTQGFRLIIGIVLNPAAVVIFSTLRTLTRTAMSILYFINRTIQPELGAAYGSGNQELFKKLYRMACRYSLWSGLVACIFLWLAGTFILSIWTHDKVQMNELLFGLLLGAALFNAFWNTPFQVAYATNRYQKIAIAYLIIYGVLSVSIAYFMIMEYGVVGAGLTVMLTEFLMAIYIGKEALKLTNERLFSWAIYILSPPGINYLYERKQKI